jgi:tetratricopeptide (TPR) repeat protein
MRFCRFLLSVLLLAGLGACASPPAARVEEPEAEGEISVTAPGQAGDTQAALPSEELPEPRAGEESAEIYGGPEADTVQPATAGATLPVPRAPAEPRKAKEKPAKSAAPTVKPATSGAAKPAIGGKPAISGEKPAAGGALGEAGPSTEAKTAAAPSPAAAETRREVLARKGDTVVIDLEGRGWLLLPGDRRGVSYTGSESGPQRTSFTFKALDFGEYDLAFQLQDNARGAARGEVVRLRVLPEDKFRDLLAAPLKAGSQPKAGSAPGQPAAQAAGQAAGETPPESADPVRLQKAERLFAGGFYDLALPEYLGIYREGDPLLNDRLAAIYLGKGEATAAVKFYDRNLSAAAPYAGKAVVGLVRAGLQLGSPEVVILHLPALLELPAAEVERELLAVARFAAEQGRFPLALDLLSEYLRRYPRGVGLDAAYFQLAQLYELESPLRDVRLAREYYRKVYEEFPESEHATEAHRRILYLDRYFFHVQ